jgi:hypothetical protein
MSNKKLKKGQIEVSKEMIDVIKNLSKRSLSAFNKISYIWITSGKARLWHTEGASERDYVKGMEFIFTGTFPDKFPEQFLPKWGVNGERGFVVDGHKFYKILKLNKNPIIDFRDIKENCAVRGSTDPYSLITKWVPDKSAFNVKGTEFTLEKNNNTPSIRSQIKIFSKEKPIEFVDGKPVVPVKFGIQNWTEGCSHCCKMSDEGWMSKLFRRYKNSPNLVINILEKDIPFLTQPQLKSRNKCLAVESVDGQPRICGITIEEDFFVNKLKTVKSRKKRYHFSFPQSFLKKLPKGDYKVIFSKELKKTSDIGIIFENQTRKNYSVITDSTQQYWLDKPKTLNQFNEAYSMSDFPKLYSKENRQIQKDSKKIAITWQKGVDAIIETGSLLLSAKKKYAKNDLLWNKFLETLPFSKRTMDRLIFIGEKKSILMNKKIYPQLPPNWGTLYELVTIGNEKTPKPRFENDNGEISDIKKKGYTEITLNTKDFIVKALEEDKLHPDTTRNEISNYKKSIEAEYFEVGTKRQIEKPDEFVIRASVSTAKKDIEQFKEGLEELLKAHPQFSLSK